MAPTKRKWALFKENAPSSFSDKGSGGQKR
jgi:hypothetical protein